MAFHLTDSNAKVVYMISSLLQLTLQDHNRNYLAATSVAHSRPFPNVSTTPIMAMGCQQCVSLSAVQLKGKHC